MNEIIHFGSRYSLLKTFGILYGVGNKLDSGNAAHTAEKKSN
jgi:hypothetical protein